MSALTCRIRVKKMEKDEDDGGGADGAVDLLPDSALVPIRAYPDVGIELRTKWAQEIMKSFATTSDKPHGQIRPWDFIIMLDESVKALAAATNQSRNN